MNINESYIFSKNNLYINFEDFESGKSNICLITGLSASGKSTLAKNLAKKYDAKVLELDNFNYCYKYSDEELLKLISCGDVYLNFFRENRDIQEKLHTIKKFGDEYNSYETKFLYYTIDYCLNDKSNRYIIEGIQIYNDIQDVNDIESIPIVIVNTSMFKSLLQRFKRNIKSNKMKRDLKDGILNLLSFYINDEKKLNKFRKNLKEGDEMEFEGLNSEIIQEDEYKEDKYIHIVEGNTIAELNKSFIKFNTYSYNEQVEFDKICMEKYNQTNKKRYLSLYDDISSRIYLNDNIKENVTTPFDTDYVNRSYNNISFIDKLNDLPYFTPIDMHELGVYSKAETNYYGEPSNIEYNDLNWYSNYHLLYKGICSEEFKELSKKRIDKLNELYNKLYNESNINVNSIKQSILELGWNPEVPFIPENRIKATINNKERLKEILSTNEFFDATNINTDNIIIDEGVKEALHPVYVILVYTATPFGRIIKQYTHGIYTHAAMSLDSKLDRLYSYNLDNNYKIFGGFSIESIKGYLEDNKDAIMCVYTTFIDKTKKEKLVNQLNYFVDNIDKTKYSILNIFSLVANKPVELANDMICSQFVDRMLKSIDIDLTGTASSLVTPNDIYKSTSNKIFKVYEGRVDNYNNKKVQTIVNKLRRSFITEAKSIPVQFDNDGNLLYIKDIKDIQEEYNKSHKLLMNYDKTGNYEAMKTELYKLWYMNLLLERKIYNKKKSDKEYHDMRARILNDFNKYLKKVNQNDPEYVFSDGYNQSQYNDSIYKIHNSTLKYGIKYAKSMINLFENDNIN